MIGRLGRQATLNYIYHLVDIQKLNMYDRTGRSHSGVATEKETEHSAEPKERAPMRNASTVDKRLKKPASTRTHRKSRSQSSLSGHRGTKDLVYFRALSENSLAGEYVVQDGRTIYVNPSLARIFGYSPSEMVGQDLLVLIHPDDRPALARKLRKPGIAHYEPLELECRGLAKDGRVIDIELQGNFTIRLNGRPARVGTILEITKRKQVEDQLQKLARAVEQSPATVVITDAKGRIEFVNPKFKFL